MAYDNTEQIQKAMASASEGASAYTSASYATNTNFMARANLSVRDEYNSGNYYNVRPGERVPTDDRGIMYACNNAYYSVGIVRNVVDLMADFCIKGVDWAHTNRNIQAFYRSWFQQINGHDVSERFCNYLIRLGNNCIYTNHAKVPDGIAEQWRRTRGEEFKDVVASSRKIPYKYIFMDITSLSEILPEIGKFSNNRTFTLSLAGGLVGSFVKTPKNHSLNSSQFDIANIIKSIPADLRNKITENNGNLVFTEKDLKVYSYKKDDWESWAKPLIYSILEPLTVLQKMHLADMSALDGAISNIRLWRLGYIDTNNALNSIIPTKAMLNKVKEIVVNNISGGVLDLFWGPELDFKESSSQVHQFLGPEKYQHVMSLIYDGMGIPPSLTGGNGGGGDGLSNNFIAMKVLIEKLNYLRTKLISFWSEEAKVVQKAMGFSSPAKIVFDDAILADESQYKQLLIDLYDRDIISLEGIREEFNLIDPIESSRLLRESKRRKKDKITPKAGPYHDPMWKVSVEADLMKRGALDPTTYGIEVDPKDILDIEGKGAPSDGGRPNGSKDRVKRKNKVVNPRTTASDVIQTQVWAKESLDFISNFVTAKFLEVKGKAYVRELTNKDVGELEDIKFGVLCAHAPFSEITEESVFRACEDMGDYSIERAAHSAIITQFSNKFGRKPTMDDRRISYAAAYSLIKNEEK